MENYQRFFSDALYAELFLKSFWYAVITTVLCLAIAYPLALLIARSPRSHRDLLVLLVILPFWSNFLIRVYAWMIILGPQSVFAGTFNAFLHLFGIGPVRLLFTPFAVVVGLVYVHLPFMVLPLYANLEKHDPALLDAAQDLGATGWQRFWRVTFPLSLPGVFAGAALVFIPAFGIFAIPDLLGGTGGIMIGNVIKQQFLDTRDWPFGSVLSMVLTVVAVGLAGLAAWYARRDEGDGMNRRSKWLWLVAILGYLFLYAPLAIVVVYSFNDSRLNAQWVGFTLDWYRKLFHNEEMLGAAWNSLLIGLTASAVSTVLGTMAGYAMYRFKLRLLPVLVVAPIAIPEILTGVSLLIFFVAIDLTLGLTSIILAHIAFCVGFVAIVVRARLAGMDESLVEAARDLGATPLQAFRLVTLPLIMPGVIAGALMAFTLSIDDFVITYFTAGAGALTLPLEIYTMVKISVTPEVNAISTLLMLLTLALIVIASRLSPGTLRAGG